jgi:hypothetical protein
MDVKNISQTEKSAPSSIERQGHVECFFDYEGGVYHTFVPRGQTVNKEYNLEVLRSLRGAVRKKEA